MIESATCYIESNKSIYNKKFQGLQVLRFFAIFIIVISHCSFITKNDNNIFIYLGSFGVYIFIMISGFLASNNDYNIGSLHDYFKYLKRKIMKFYPLHIITLLIAVPFSISLFQEDKFEFIYRFLSNLFLIHAYIPNKLYYFSFNFVSWYLSLNLFFIFVAPFINRILRKIDFKFSIILIIFLSLFEITINVLYYEKTCSHWLLYVFPFIRIIDFFLGGLFFEIIIHINNISNRKKITIYYFSILLSLLVMIAIVYMTWNYNTNNLYLILPWVIPSFSLLISSTIDINDFKIKKLIENKLFIMMGNISFYTFIIHQLIIRYNVFLFDRLNINILFSYFLSIVMSFSFSYFIYFVMKIFFKKKNHENDIDKKENRSIVENIFIVAISNILSLASGILVGFILPKIMPKADYGFYKTFTLYLSYIGLFPLGFIDGIYLIYAGIKYDALDKERFRTYTKFLILFQTIISITMMLLSIPFMNFELGVIFFCLGINVVFNSMNGYYQCISQITGRFKELSFRNTIRAILTSLSIIVLTAIYYFHIIDTISYILYTCIYTVISIVLTLWYVFTYKDILIGKSSTLSNEKREIINFFKVGLPLLIANLVSSFILTIDRQFVSVLFDIETYASYAFAYNMLSLITTVISAISVVLYPTIKIFNDVQLKKNYNRLNAIIAIVVSFCACSYYPLKFIIENFLPNYVDSLPIFRIILPGLVISSCISMIMFNYYKALNMQTRYFIISLIILGLSFGANMLTYYIYETPIAISIASVIVMGVWYFIVEFTIVRRYRINSIKNILYILSLLSSFYLLTYFIDNVFIGFGVYFVLFVSITLLFHFKLIRTKFRFDK